MIELRQRLGSADVLVGLDDGVVGLMEGDGIIGAYPVAALDGGSELDIVVERGSRIIYGERQERKSSLGSDLDGVGALVLDASAVVKAPEIFDGYGDCK